MGGLISFTGPSGAGKTSIITGLVQAMPGLRFVPSYTTRSPRPSDFPTEFRHVSLREFEEIDKREEFLWSVEAHGNRYGTRKADVDEARSHSSYSVMTLVPPAAAQLFSYTKGKAIPFFILPPREEILRLRLAARGETTETIARRIEDCASWVQEARESQIPYRYISNEGTVEEAVREVKGELNV